MIPRKKFFFFFFLPICREEAANLPFSHLINALFCFDNFKIVKNLRQKFGLKVKLGSQKQYIIVKKKKKNILPL
jgi:hypothetical protein